MESTGLPIAPSLVAPDQDVIRGGRSVAFWSTLQQAFGLLFVLTLIWGVLSFPYYKRMLVGYVPVGVGLGLACIASHRSVATRIERFLTAWPQRRFLIAVVGVAVVLRVVAVLLLAEEPVSDHDVYHRTALRMLNGQGYGPTAYFAPGMSFWLLLVYWLFGESLLAAWLVNAGVGGVFTWLTYDVGRRVVAEPAARLAAVLAAVFPSLVLYATTLGNDPLLGCAVFTAVTLFLRRPPAGTHPAWYVALIGVVLGAVTFLKPIGLLLPAVFGLCYWRRGATLARSLRNGAILAVVLFATILPWSIRNVLVFGEYVAVTTGGGAALWMTNHPNATALSEKPPDFPPGTSEVQQDRILWKRSWEHILRHPDRFICMLLPKAAYLWGTSSTVVSTASADRWERDVERAAKFVINVAWTFVCVLFIVAIWRDGLCRSTVAFWPVVCLLAYLWGIHLFYEAQSRYHLAFLPVLFIGAAAAMLRRRPVDV